MSLQYPFEYIHLLIRDAIFTSSRDISGFREDVMNMRYLILLFYKI